MKHIILMGDVIKSRVKEQQRLILELKETVLYINTKHKKEILSPLTITLGDEFQAVVKNIDAGLSIILEIEEFVIKNKFSFKLRYVLHQGKIDTEINSVIAYEMLGEGLSEARNKLNQIKSTENRFNISIDSTITSTVINNSFVILDNIINKWDIESDFEIVAEFLDNIDYKEVANNLNRNRSLIWKREKTLNIKSYRAAKEIILLANKLNRK